MTSGSALSPLGFTRDYQHYRARAAAIPYRDTLLLQAARFWSERSAALGDPAYETFWREDLPPLLEAAGAPDFHDLLPDELEALAKFIERLPPLELTSGIAPPSLWELAAKKWLYVGEVERALRALSHTAIGAGVDVEPITSASDDPCEPHEWPQRLLERHGDHLSPSLVEWLKGVDSEWRACLDGGSPNRATCVVVEQDHSGRPLRGRLRILEGQLEKLNNGNGGHQVVFAHQLRSPDDPQIAGAYAALAALAGAESGTRRTEWKGPVGKPKPVSWRAGYVFIDAGRELHGGASLAFACFATGYGDLWSKDLHRARMLISHAVALTGALAPDGGSASISAESLACKVERVFYSPLASLAVPKSNRDAAEAAVTALHLRHPRRRLRIIAIDRAADLATDGNIMIPERVCPAEFALRAAAKYGRNVKVQVPALAVLAYLLLCLVYPKAWVGFDRNPACADYVGNRLVVMNAKSNELWSYQANLEMDQSHSSTVFGDLDGDDRPEVISMLTPRKQASSMRAGEMIAFDHDGTELFKRVPVIMGQYPGDTSILQQYDFGGLALIERETGSLILTVVLKSYPSRAHFMLWSAEGDLVGWYINAGYAGGPHAMIVDTVRSVLHVLGVNNRVPAACYFILPLDSCHGVSPPFADSVWNLRSVEQGNQIRYIVFPPTDVCIARREPYNGGLRLVNEAGLVRVDVDELSLSAGSKDSTALVNYYLDERLTVVSARCSDLFRSIRNRLVSEGTLPPIDWREYQDALVMNVRYWSDSVWTTSF
ncbi:MAG TPA: hypothetical protein VNN55_10895 [bacterium]|nr:hypothetical protein [bacterium]